MKMPTNLLFSACLAGIALMGLAGPQATRAQGYQVQGNYNPAAVQAPRQSSLIPAAYQQQGYVPQGPAYQPGPSLPSYRPQTPTRLQPAPSAPTDYSRVPTSQLPPAYAQQGQYAQPQPYPGHAPTKPRPSYQTPAKQAPSTSSEIAALKQKDREQDRRLSILESRTTTSHTAPKSYTQHTVRRGDSFWALAERYGVSESAIKAANRRTTDVVVVGEVLNIPIKGGSSPTSSPAATGSTHIVQPRETLSTIAAAYRVSTRSLQEANGIVDPNLVEVGRVLTIPSKSARRNPLAPAKPKPTVQYVSKPHKAKSTVVHSEVPVAAEGLSSVAKVTGPRGVTSYRVETGDGIESVARSFSTTPAEIQRMNKLSSPSLPAVGEEIIVPLPGSVAL